jgi:uncharacterized protein (TIGR02996 family)
VLGDLLAELAANPDDADLVRVYADWLMQLGHPAGELAIVQLEARGEHSGDVIDKREYELFWNQVVPFMKGALARDHVSELAFRRGVAITPAGASRKSPVVVDAPHASNVPISIA